MTRRPHRYVADVTRFEATKARQALRGSTAPVPADPGTVPSNRSERRQAARRKGQQ